jgi:RNA polymerase sigma-70 factor (ECF subfamily)
MPARDWTPPRDGVAPPAAPVADGTFQDEFEPYPRHWRRPPRPWTAEPDPALLRAALAELPDTWRRAVLASDVRGRARAEVADELGLTAAQLRAVLDQARAVLRGRLDAAQGAR